MQWLPLSKTESKNLTEAVILFQKHRHDTKLYHALHKKTQQILYYMPAYLHLLEEEDCSAFLLYCYESIDHYLTTYKLGGLSYIGYLTQVVRKRCKYFLVMKRADEHKERIILESEYLQEGEQPLLSGETAQYTTFSSKLVSEMDTLPKLFNQLLYARTIALPLENPKLKVLQKLIASPVNRKRFLIVLTLSPNLANQYLLEELAMLLEVEVPLLSQYLNTAGMMFKEKERLKEEFQMTSNRHFRRLLEIENQLQNTAKREEYERLEALRTWTVKVYKAKVEQIRTMEFRLSHRQLGVLLNIPKGTIDSSVHYMKRVLREYVDETGDKEYL
ncbi:MAG: hypothetical protein AB7D92_03685 [Sphaerochaeta sp.]